MYQHPTQPFPPMPSSAFPQGPPKQQSAHPQEPVMNGHPQQFMPPGHHSHQPSVQSVTSDMGRMHMNGPAQAQPTMPPSLPVQQAAPNSVSHYEQPPPVPVPQSQVQHMQPMTQPQPQQPPQSYHPGPPFSTSARPTGHAPPPVPVSSHMSAPGAPPPARPAPIQSYGGPPPVPYSQPPTQAPQPPVVSQSIPPPGAIPGQVQMRPPAPMTSPNVAPAAHQPFPMSQAAVQQQPYHQQPVHQQRPPQVGGPGFPPQAPASVASQPPAFPQRPPVAQLPPVPGQMQGMPQPTATSQFQGGTASPGQLPPLPVPPMPGQGQRPGMPAPSGPMGHPGFHQPAHAGLPPGLPPQPGFQQQAGYPPQGPGQAGYPPGVSQQMGGGMPAGPPMPGMQQQHAMTGGYGPQMTGPPGAPMGMAQPQQQRKLDARMMPSVVQVMKDDRATRSGPFPTGYPFAESPPLVTTDFFCEDQGNASPRFMRCSLYNMPANQDLVKQSLIPIVAAVTPFAERHPNEVFPLPVIDLGDLGPVRCNRCKAYMNPFMEFFDGGRRFKCPFCHGTTEVPEQYFAHLDQTGRRVDIAERPELTRGSYELVATKEYCKGNLYPKKPVFMFMIDVSYNAVKSGLVSLFCQNVKQLLKRLPKEETANESAIEVAFVTYDQSLHFYNLKSCVGLPQMLVVGDVGDVFVPIADGLFVSPVEAEAAIDSLMTEIPKMFSETKVVEVVLGPVVQAGLDALKASDRSGKLFITHEASDRSGKLFILHSTLPIMDAPGKLQSRDERSLLGTEKEKQVLSPNKNQAEFYSSLSKACVEAGCCVDVFVTPNNYVDVATIGTMCAATGGSLYRYQYFQAERDGERLLRDLDHDISRPIAFDAVMRVRCSEGIRPTDFFGNLFMDNTTDVQLAAVDCDKCVTVQIKHDDKLPEDGGAYIQAALLYTSVSGQRRLRIHNLALKVGTDLVSLYKTADLECIMNFFLKQAEQLTLSKSAREMRESMISRCAQMLATYRTKCAHESAVGQLILPEAMKLLPLYMNCLIKHDAFTGGSEMTSDDRAILMQYIPPLTIGEAIGYLYPRLTPLIELEKENATEAAASPEDVEQLRCSSENLDSAGAYILENGLNVFVWIGSNVPREWLTEVFNVDSHANVDEDMRSVPLLNNTTSQKVHKLLQRVQSERHRFMKLMVVKQGGKLEAWFKKFLVEDQAMGSAHGPQPSYVEFLCHIHKEIKELIN